MLKNKADKLVLKALLEVPVPELMRREDAALAQRCGDELKSLANRLLMGRSEQIEILTPTVLTTADKADITNLITRSPDGLEKRDLIFFYRLAVLVETVLLKYRA